MDVLSNIPFAIGGLWGLSVLYRLPISSRVSIQWRLCATFFVGLVLTAVCSGYYHWQPDDSGLALDRLGMVLAFAGLAGVAAAERVSGRAAFAVALVVLVAGSIGIAVWLHNGNLLVWSLVQGGGMLVVFALAWCKPLSGAWNVSFAQVIGIYALAKLCEFSDAEVFALTQGWLSGHSLKHLVAALAAWPVILAVHNAHAASSTESKR
jgi:hypothetical protein